MDENNQETSCLTDDGSVKPKQGCSFVMEMIMFTFFLAKTFSDTVIVNLLERNTCLVVLNYNLTNCSDPISPTMEGQLQQSTANVLVARSVIESFAPSLLALFIGPWSDTNGRRPLILLSLAAYSISTVMWCVLSVIPGLHPLYFLLTSIPVALGGGYVTFFLALYCCISDTTRFDQRAMKMSLLEGACMAGVLISSLCTPYLLKTSVKYGYTIVFATSATLLILTFLYSYIYVQETVTIVESERTKLWNVEHVKEVFETCFRSRPNHIRTIVMCIILNLAIFIILMEGELAVMYMFMQKAFSWTLEEYTRFVGFVILVSGASVIFVMWFFTKALKIADLPLMFMGTLCMLCKAFIQAIAKSGLYFYVSGCFNVITVLISPLSRSQLSKLIPPDDLGKIFAFTSFMESTAPLLTSPLYTFVYKATMDTLPTAVFWLSTGLCAVSVLLIGSALALHRLSPETDLRPILSEEDDGKGTSVQA